MDLPYIYILVINNLLFFCVWCLLLLKPSNSGGQILKACHREYSAFLFFFLKSSFAYSIDHTSKDVLLPRVWLQRSALSLMLHFNLKIIIKNPFVNTLQLHWVTAMRAPIVSPCEAQLWGTRVVLFCLIYLKFQGHTEIASGRSALFSPVWTYVG